MATDRPEDTASMACCDHTASKECEAQRSRGPAPYVSDDTEAGAAPDPAPASPESKELPRMALARQDAHPDTTSASLHFVDANDRNEVAAADDHTPLKRTSSRAGKKNLSASQSPGRGMNTGSRESSLQSRVGATPSTKRWMARF
jgi:hypothetical protein